jgi:FkbM family methyltransferase
MSQLKTFPYHRVSVSSDRIFNFFEKIIRSHPLIYFLSRGLIRFTNIFEQDFDGVRILNLNDKVNIIDVGASDGIASKFFNKNLNIGSIICYEPNNYYVNILKKINIKNLIVKPFAIGNTNGYTTVFFPRYKFFFRNFDLIPYTCYNKENLIKLIFLDFKFRKNISIIKKKIFIKKVNKINKKIDLIKIDTNGSELSVVKGLLHIIKRDRPALIIESCLGIENIPLLLKKFSYKAYYFSPDKKKFSLTRKKYSLNTYFLQKKHLI